MMALVDAAQCSVILAALAAGLAAAYGRELGAGSVVDRRWWVHRLLAIPLLAILASAAAEAFHFSASITAFAAGMLALGGYDILHLIEARVRRSIEGEDQPASEEEVNAAS